ncbi:MAG: hypothetical protein K8953_00355, partial [Proteobacteria bacterium]|nr:hypothetical protein [Pseudomonadota bacterium]
TGRCSAALDDVRCLKDPFGTCEGTDLAQLNFVTGGDGAALFTTLKTNRLVTCRGGDLVNSQKNICRTADTATAACLRNPFGNCTTELGTGNIATYRTNRVTYCEGASAAQGAIINTSTATIGNTDINLCNAPSTEIDAAGIICGDTVQSSLSVVAGTGDTRDPFRAVCRQIAEYNTKRTTWLNSCLSVSVPSDSPYTCNYATQIAYCNVADGGRPTNCPAVQIVSNWAALNTNTNGVIVDPVEYQTIRGVKNNFLNNFGHALAVFPSAHMEHLNHDGTSSGTTLVGARLEVANFPSILAFSARSLAVNYTSGDISALTDENDGVDGVQIDDPYNAGTEITVAEGDVKTRAGHQRFYAGIRPLGSFSLGAPIFDRSTPEAVWNGSIHWIGNGSAANSQTEERTPRTNFKMRVNYNTRVIEGAVPVTLGNTTGNHIVIDGEYTQAGIINGKAYIRNYTANPNGTSTPNILAAGAHDTNMEGIVSGILGYRGAVGVFVGPEINGTTVTDSFSGGFVVRPQ